MQLRRRGPMRGVTILKGTISYS